MSSIRKHSGENFGGNYKVYYAIRSEVIDQIDFLMNPIELSQAVVDAYFYEISLPFESIDFKEPEQLNQHGSSFTPTVSFKIHKDRQDIRDQISKVGRKGLWLLLIDNNGQAKLIGDEDNVVYQQASHDSSDQVIQPNHYQYTISAQTSVRSRLVSII